MRFKTDITIEQQDISGNFFHMLWNKMEAVENQLKTLDVSKLIENSRTFNDKCHVHVGGLGLMLINEVCVVKDVCTHALQDNLNEGWRILAVCVQPDQRRPDYILGRTTEK